MLPQKVGRIVYLGGIVPSEDNLSPHMSSRAVTGSILRDSGVPTIELRAEMKMPGLAWLEFKIEPTADGKSCTITQTATYAPKGLLGHLYWWSVWPMHGIVFSSMIKKIARG